MLREPLTEAASCDQSLLVCCYQVAVLECVGNPSQKLLVATTHFYWHPQASHVRVIQAAIALRHVESVLTSYKEKVKSCVRLNKSYAGFIRILKSH